MEKPQTFRYWVVKCATEGCGAYIGLECLGANRTDGPQHIYFLPGCRDFKEPCPQCGEEHTYSHEDVQQENGPPPSRIW